MSDKTLFEKIADREIPADIIYEDERCVGFRDVNPQAPTHVLVIPRKRISTVDDLTEGDRELVGHLVLVASKIAREEGLDGGYRLVLNCGDDGGQSVYHIHLHVMGGRRMGWPPG